MHRLTPFGATMAPVIGKWIQQHVMEPYDLSNFDRTEVSPYVRCIETAANLGIPQTTWEVNYNLRERDHGDSLGLSNEEYLKQYSANAAMRVKSPLYWRPPGGESDLDVALLRVPQLYPVGGNAKSALFVTHSGLMRAHLFAQTHSYVDPWDIGYGHIQHYTRVDPDSGRIDIDNLWFRQVTPENPDITPAEWQKLNPATFSPESALVFASNTPRLFDG
jgi:broad specificity phosphatase PhoE